MQQRRTAGCGGVRMLRHVALGGEPWTGVTALLAADRGIMQRRVDPARAHVGVAARIPARVEQWRCCNGGRIGQDRATAAQARPKLPRQRPPTGGQSLACAEADRAGDHLRARPQRPGRPPNRRCQQPVALRHHAAPGFLRRQDLRAQLRSVMFHRQGAFAVAPRGSGGTLRRSGGIGDGRLRGFGALPHSAGLGVCGYCLTAGFDAALRRAGANPALLRVMPGLCGGLVGLQRLGVLQCRGVAVPQRRHGIIEGRDLRLGGAMRGGDRRGMGGVGIPSGLRHSGGVRPRRCVRTVQIGPGLGQLGGHRGFFRLQREQPVAQLRHGNAVPDAVGEARQVPRAAPVLGAFQYEGMRRQVAGVMRRRWREPSFRPACQPVRRGAHVAMRRLLQVGGGGGEQDARRRCRHHRDGLQRRRFGHVLQHLDAGQQVVFALDRFGDRAGVAERPYIGPHLPDRPAGDVAPVGLHAAVPQAFDQQAQRATSIERPPWRKRPHQLVGDLAEEAQPVIVAFVGHRAAMRGVVARAIKRIWFGCRDVPGVWSGIDAVGRGAGVGHRNLILRNGLGPQRPGARVAPAAATPAPPATTDRVVC